MPIVLRYDDPALLATLAGRAGQFATNERETQQALQLQAAGQRQQQIDNQYRLAQQQQDLEQQRLQMLQQQYQDQRAAAAPGGTGVAAGGQTIYYPQGMAVPADEAARAAAGQAGVPAGGGYVNPQQQQALATIAQMEQSGQLSPNQAARWRGSVALGKNPFSDLTDAEYTARHPLPASAAGGIAPAAEAELGLKAAASADHLDETAYNRRRQAYLDKISSLKERAKLLPLNDTEGAKAIQDGLKTYEDKLLNLPDERKNVNQPGAEGAPAGPVAGIGESGGGPDPATTKVMQFVADLLGKQAGKGAKGNTAAGPAAAGGEGKKPLTEALLDQYLRDNGYDPAKARAAARADGFNTSIVITPDQAGAIAAR